MCQALDPPRSQGSRQPPLQVRPRPSPPRQTQSHRWARQRPSPCRDCAAKCRSTRSIRHGASPRPPGRRRRKKPQPGLIVTLQVSIAAAALVRKTLSSGSSPLLSALVRALINRPRKAGPAGWILSKDGSAASYRVHDLVPCGRLRSIDRSFCLDVSGSLLATTGAHFESWARPIRLSVRARAQPMYQRQTAWSAQTSLARAGHC